MDNNTNNINNEVEINKENEEAYNNLIQNAKPKDNGDWDINSPVIKVILAVLGIIIVIGLIFYFVLFLKMK